MHLSEVPTSYLPPPTDSTDEINLAELFAVVRRRRAVLLRSVLVALALGIALFFVLPNTYTATTSILPPQASGSSSAGMMMAQMGSALGGLASMAGGGGGLSLKNPNDLQVALMKSRTVEDAMVERFHLQALYKTQRMSDARGGLEHQVAIDAGAKDGLIRIKVTDRDPQRAAALANGYVEEFRRATSGLAVTEASQRRLFFEQQLASAKNDLANAEEALKNTEQKTGLLQLDGQTRAVIGSVAQLRAEITAKEVQIRGMQSFATGENPDLQTAQEELAALKQQLARSGGSADSLTIPHGNLQESGVEYIRRLRDVKYYETIFDLLARQYEIAKVDEARQGSIIQVVDKAVVPDRRSWPRLTILGPVSIAVGALVGIVLIAWLEIKARRAPAAAPEQLRTAVR